MIKRVFLIIAAVLLTGGTAFGWGREGHEIIAKIADNNLKPSVRKVVERYLGGHSVVYYAKWMDDYRRTPEYKFTSPWHVFTVDESLNHLPKPEGDALSGLNQAIEILKDHKSLSDSTVAVNIKYIIHLVGDMHCPSHICYDGRDYNFVVRFGGGYIQPELETKVHGVWDYLAIQSCRIMSASEYAEELDRCSRKEIRSITAGTVMDWADDNAHRCLAQFELAHPGDQLAQDFINEAMPLIEIQMLYGGYRLAYLLNSLF